MLGGASLRPHLCARCLRAGPCVWTSALAGCQHGWLCPCGHLGASRCCIRVQLELLKDMVRTGLMAEWPHEGAVNGADRRKQLTAEQAGQPVQGEHIEIGWGLPQAHGRGTGLSSCGCRTEALILESVPSPQQGGRLPPGQQESLSDLQSLFERAPG